MLCISGIGVAGMGGRVRQAIVDVTEKLFARP